MKRWTLLMVPVVALAAAAFAPPPGADRTVPPATHRVRMIQQGQQYLFQPANMTIASGDLIDYVNVSGGPHNVQFTPSKIPAGAAEVLNRGMPNRMGPLAGPMITQPNAVYRVNFAGAPAGTYEVICLPHQALGMKGVVTVRR